MPSEGEVSDLSPIVGKMGETLSLGVGFGTFSELIICSVFPVGSSMLPGSVVSSARGANFSACLLA